MLVLGRDLARVDGTHVNVKLLPCVDHGGLHADVPVGEHSVKPVGNHGVHLGEITNSHLIHEHHKNLLHLVKEQCLF